jgi:hypothetical protein
MTQTEIEPLLKLTPWRIEDCIRTVYGVRYLVPPTSQWADWHDVDAIRHHGVYIGQATSDDVRRAIESIAVLDAWDNQVHGRPTKTQYSPVEQFELLQFWGATFSKERSSYRIDPNVLDELQDAVGELAEVLADDDFEPMPERSEPCSE